jgi:hypothetical protein
MKRKGREAARNALSTPPFTTRRASSSMTLASACFVCTTYLVFKLNIHDVSSASERKLLLDLNLTRFGPRACEQVLGISRVCFILLENFVLEISDPETP